MNHSSSPTLRGVQPFWFWNGTMRADEIRRQILSMKAQGVRGFFLHPRQGMDLPYLSDRFLEMVGVAVDTARREQMQMWLYDEYPYPSGVAGGELLLNPAYIARVLKHEVFDARGHVEKLLPWGKVLLARAYPVRAGRVDWSAGIDLSEKIGIIYLREIFQPVGLSSYNRKRFFTGEHAKQLWWDAPAGDWRVFVFLEQEMGDFKYFGGFVDPVNPDAMRDYLRLTHDRYYRAFPEAFGTVIRGIFTDETAPMGRNPMWSPRMPALFAARYGYDLIERLPAFVADTDGDDEKFLYDYHNALIDAFTDSYDRPIRAWCEAHGVRYVGEKEHLRGEQIAEMHIPGLDNGHVKAGGRPTIHTPAHRANPKSVASYAHFTGDNTALCEAYHSLGWDMTLRDMRWAADWLGAQGVNFIVPHAFYYTDDALRKHDAPPSAFESMPWYAHAGLYTAHVDRLSALTLHGRRYARVLVVDPAGAAYAQRDEAARAVPGRVALEYALTARHVDYYLIDRDLLAETTAEGGQIALRGERFDALLLPDMPLLEAEAVAAAQRARAGGAQVIAVGRAPRRNISTGEVLPAQGAPWHVVTSPEACAALLPQGVQIQRNGQECGDILAARFDWEGETWLYTVNLTGNAIPCNLSLPGAGDVPMALVDTISGEATALPGTAAAFAHTWPPFACALFRTGVAPAPQAVAARVVIDPAQACPCRPQSPNLLRIARFDADLGGNHMQAEAMPVINQLTENHARIEAVERSGFGCVKRLEFPPMPLVYQYRFMNQYPGAVRFVMEPGSIRGEHTIEINGSPLPPLAEIPVFKRSNLAADITPLLRPGENVLTVRVAATRDDDGVVNPLYLAGGFALSQADGLWTLQPDAGQASPLHPEAHGYPFYAGAMDYALPPLPGDCAEQWVEIALEDARFEHCAELLVNGESLGAAAWAPYAWRTKAPAGAALTLRVHGTMLAAFEGAWFDQEAHRTVSV